MQTLDDRTAIRTPAHQAEDAARDSAAPEAFWTAPAGARPSAPRHARKAALLAVLAGGLTLTGCASGINKAEDACAAHRTTMAAYAFCLRTNHAMLVSGPPAERDLASLYMAAADYLANQVRVGRASDAEAMFALAQYRTNDLAAKAQSRHDAAFKQAIEYMQAQGQGGQSGGGSGSGSGQRASYGRSGSR